MRPTEDSRIMEAQQILLLATGKDKVKAVKQSLEGQVSFMWPASMLQLHERAIVLLDEAAVLKLKLYDYYKWITKKKHKVMGQYKN